MLISKSRRFGAFADLLRFPAGELIGAIAGDERTGSVV